jgi:hypothetical protein
MLYYDGNDVMHRSGARIVVCRFNSCLQEISSLLSYVKVSGSFALNLDTKYKQTMADIMIPWDLPSSAILRGVDWQLFTDVSGVLGPWRRNRWVVPKRRQISTNEQCVTL